MNGHGPLCACPVHSSDDFDDELAGKAITRAAEVDDFDTCD